MLFAQFDRPQLLLLAGMVMLGWVLLRRSLGRRRRVIREGRQATRDLHQLRNPKAPNVPLCDAPPELQRWQVAMFDLQRELKGEIDSRIAIAQALIVQADARIAELQRLRTTDRETPPRCDEQAVRSRDPGPPAPTPPAPPSENIGDLATHGLTFDEIAERTGRPVSKVEWKRGTREG